MHKPQLLEHFQKKAKMLGGTPGRGQVGEHSPRADNFLVLMIFAAYSCVEVFFTHLRTTEKAPLEGKGGKNWDMEQSRVTQTHFRSEDSYAPITRSLVKITHTHQHSDHDHPM